MRISSDSLQFTGVDLGEQNGGAAPWGGYGESDDDEGEVIDSASISEYEYDVGGVYGDDADTPAVHDMEEALVRSALQRIGRARAKGRDEVKLNKEELAALDRRRQRIQEEEERQRRNSAMAGDARKKGRKEHRIAVPLSQVAPISRKERLSTASIRPRRESFPEGPEMQAYPRMGYFPPPSSSRTRPRSGTTSSTPHSRPHEDRAFSPNGRDEETHAWPSKRHVSESGPRRHASRASNRDDYSSSRSQVDPFQYLTGASPASYPNVAPASSRRYASGPAVMSYGRRRGPVASSPSSSRQGSQRRSCDDQTSDSSRTSEGTAADDRGNGVRIREPPGRGRDVGIVVEASPERGSKTPPKKKSSSPVKRKPMPGGRRKKK
ncbi:hypothetical protein RJ55_01415 [Drechmeria coniospora]|nr:hypothetical protein RJ55_01415 [Drechmeria coniospora]